MDTVPETTTTEIATRKRSLLWVYDLLLILVLLVGAFFRFTGLGWDEYTWLHPDERFLVWVTADIEPVSSLGEYFDTANSTLNPHNRNHGFFVYGTFPIFLTRYLVSLTSDVAGWQEIAQVGRPLSAVFDLLTILLVYLTAARLYDRRVALLSAAFLSAAVLPIQLSNFYKEDTFLNFFTLLAMYYAIRIATRGRGSPDSEPDQADAEPECAFNLRREWPLYAGFGLALGLAVSSKLNAAPMAFILPLAVWVRFSLLSPQARRRNISTVLLLLVIAGAVSFLTFRVFQPYAFSGPGFFGIRPNPQWVANIREQRAQAAGDIDFPPSLQWARRPLTFAWQNMVQWGFGLPLGLLAWAGFLWIGWRMLRGEWRIHILMWSWTAVYFAWQSVALNPTMRYFLPVYPMLAIFAAWAIVRLWDLWQARRSAGGSIPDRWSRAARISALVLGFIVLASTYTYAYAFSTVHVRPVTRVAASRWIFENIPGPINLSISTRDGPVKQMIPYPYEFIIRPDVPFFTTFVPAASGQVDEVVINDIVDQYTQTGTRSLFLRIQQSLENPEPLSLGTANLDVSAVPADGFTQPFNLDRNPFLSADQSYSFVLELGPGQGPLIIDGRYQVVYETEGEEVGQVIELGQRFLEPLSPQVIDFFPSVSGTLRSVRLEAQLVDPPAAETRRLELVFSNSPDGAQPLATGFVEADFSRPAPDGGYKVELDRPLQLQEAQPIFLSARLQAEDEASGVYLQGAGFANEGEWDDGLPLRLGGYDPFGGIYQQDMNFNMYWDDNPQKLARFERILTESDYIAISSSRQWASLTRLPERFPLVTTYYRNLLGCPPEETIEHCYNVAQPGMFTGSLGFELVKVFQSNPQIGSFEINDQSSEEAFTVYDHPKVFIFQKTADYDPEQVSEILGAVDFSQIIRVTPKRAASHPMDLMLPADRLAEQVAGGTWSELFPSEGLLNRYQPLGVVVWYLFIALLGLLTFPFIRMAFPGLADRGYAVSRVAGMLVFAYLAWLLGSFDIPVTQTLLGVLFVVLLVAGAAVAILQRRDLVEFFKARRNYILAIELLALVAFLFFLLVRLGNPDLWHPWKGGEKPMDFSYFNAILKSTSFPPYDPWYAGGYINYYYYGFVLVGMPVKLLGITPSVAYNLILPTIFLLILIGAFSLGFNLMNSPPRREANGTEPASAGFLRRFARDMVANRGYVVGLLAALLVGLFGNLGTLRMITRGYQMIASPGTIEGAGFLNRLLWGLQGFFRTLTGADLPYGIADWYWLPSRAIAALGDVEPITEFPYFSLLYADLHAHLIALPVTLLALTWSLAVIQGRGRWKNIAGVCAAFVLGGLAIGALRPTNTWDLPTYLVIGMLAVFYGLWLGAGDFAARRLPFLTNRVARLALAAGGAALLAVLAIGLYQPFAYWYGQGYSSIDFWQGSRTPLLDYFTHWGIFLFLIGSWMVSETVDWLASTPLSALRKLQPYRQWIWGSLVLLTLLMILLGIKIPGIGDLPIGRGVNVVWFVLPLAAWAAVLLLRPSLSTEKRIVLFLVGTGLVLTLVVEVIVLVGDIGRMNTVFKFYLQVWVLFGISAAAAFGWVLEKLPVISLTARRVWQVGVVALLLAAAMYPLLATTAKIKDRFAPDAPRSLDGLGYMSYANYFDQGLDMDLSQDYEAIRWLQENVIGSPVILEGNTVEYRWGSRYTINTGLPGVVGWNWHQRQQRGSFVPGEAINNRIAEIAEFYITDDPQAAYQLLKKYGVQYFIVGQLEQAYYPGPGLDKFALMDGNLWDLVFESGATRIYQVRPQAETARAPSVGGN